MPEDWEFPEKPLNQNQVQPMSQTATVNPFKKAEKIGIRLRMGLSGPSKSGKTFTALSCATELTSRLGGRIAFIDTEYGSALRYADQFDFDHVSLTDFSVESYVSAIEEAERAGYTAIIIDSASHAWMSESGLVQRADTIAKASRSQNSFQAWAEIRPIEAKFWNAILASTCHIIMCFRTKTEYVVEQNDKGKSAPRKVGLAPIQRADVEYELDIIGELTMDNTAIFTGRCKDLKGKLFKEPGKNIMDIIIPWLGSQDDDESTLPPPPVVDRSDNVGMGDTPPPGGEKYPELTGPGFPDNAIDTIEKISKGEEYLHKRKTKGWVTLAQQVKSRAQFMPNGIFHDEATTLGMLHHYLKYVRETAEGLPD